jgi:hypothetical protein
MPYDMLSDHIADLESIFTEELDTDFYRTSNPDLAHMSDDELGAHYESHGIAEGRLGHPIALRECVIDALASFPGSILEIGPFYQPACSGPNVRYFDVQDAAGLHEHAGKEGLSEERIPEVIHYVHESSDLSAIPETFDVVFSSHVIEHQPDLIHHLNGVNNILNDRGVYIAVIPDKRFCFDHFIPETSIGEIIEAHAQRRTRHTISAHIDAIMGVTHNDATAHWEGRHGERPLSRMEWEWRLRRGVS